MTDDLNHLLLVTLSSKHLSNIRSTLKQQLTSKGNQGDVVECQGHQKDIIPLQTNVFFSMVAQIM